MKKISTVFAVGIVMFTLVGCVPGETVVTISAEDVGCVMTGGVGRAEVVSTLKNSIPKFDLSKISKPAFEQFDLPKMPKPTLERFDRSRISKLALGSGGTDPGEYVAVNMSLAWRQNSKAVEGPAGLASPRWSCSYEDAIGRTIAEVRPGFRGALLIASNEYNTANQLVARRTYSLEQPVLRSLGEGGSSNSSPSPLTYTLICYNTLGQRTLTVSDMNLNGQIDWSDTDRIVSNDTRYISLNGSWWRESSTWQTRQNGSSVLTRFGLTRTRLTGLASWTKRAY